MAQNAVNFQICRWQREYFESKGIPQDAGMRAVWSIPETFVPTPRKGASDSGETGGDTNALLQAFGQLRVSVNAAVQAAIVDATKPPTKPVVERRFAPKAGALQTSGALSRDFVLAFARQCTEMLTSVTSIEQLAACDSMSAIGALSVTWQRELLEHLGCDMDHGCRALGDVPMRFHDDSEVMNAFKAFQHACSTSAQRASQRAEELAEKPKADAAASGAAEVQ